MIGAVTAIAVPYVAGVLKSPTPRQYGFLPGTILNLRNGVEGKGAYLNGRTYNAVETVVLMDTQRKTDNGMAGVWQDLLPTWSPTPAALSEIRRRDPNFQPRGGTGGAGSTGGTSTALSLAADAPQPTDRGALPLWIVLGIAGVAGYVIYRTVKKAA